jgi:amino acid transporter
MTTTSGHDERHRLTAVQGLAALSLDALSSVAYGPEAILVVLVAAGTAGLHYSLPITGAIIILLAALVVSYRQVIAAFPGGGGAYAVAKAHLGTRASLVAAASLIVDYVLNAAVGVSAGIAALTSAFPALYGGRVWLCLAALALITGLNLWGVAESAKAFTVPTLLFIVAIAAVILGGLFRTHAAVPLGHHLGPATETVGVLLILRAFASGCSALTGVEAIANAVPEFRRPRARRAQATEVWLGILLGVMLIGLGALIHKFSVVPQPGITVLAQLTQASLGHNIAFYAVQLITLVLLALAANTSFGGLPVLAALLAKDNFLPHMFGLRADRQVHRYGVVTLALLAAALLVAAKGDTQALVPLFAVGVFVGFTLSQVGMVRHWSTERSGGWIARAAVNGAGDRGHHPHRAGQQVHRGRLGDRARHPGPGAAVQPDPPHLPADRHAARAGQDAEAAGQEEVPRSRASRLDIAATLRTAHRSIAQPIVKYLARIEAEERYHQLVVLIPEVQPPRFWDYLLFNQRGVILERAIRRGTATVVLCRLHYRLEHFTPRGDSGGPASQDRRADRGGRADGRDHGQARVLEGGGEDLIGDPEQTPER